MIAALTNIQWILIAGVVFLYLMTCFRVAIQFRRAGRNPVRWFFITFFFTAIPAAVYASMIRFKALQPRSRSARPAGSAEDGAAAVRKCRHCGEVLTRKSESPGGVPVCPNCKMPTDEEHLA